MEFQTPRAKRGSVCAVVDYQWCEELWFADAANSHSGQARQV